MELCNDIPHQSILLEEMLTFFQPLSMRAFFEGTVGAGGHAAAVLQAHPEIEFYIGCDQDPVALEIAEKRLKPWGDKVRLIHANFSQMNSVVEGLQWKDGIDGFFLI